MTRPDRYLDCVSRRVGLLLTLAIFTFANGCVRSNADQPEVVVYAALDAEFSEPILDDYERLTEVDVRTNFDVESTKTVGLVTRIIAEKDRPRCDVFWNNEILHTLRLKKLGLLEAVVIPAADSFPWQYRSRDNDWYGLAARARILIVNTDKVKPEDEPTSILELADAKWQGKAGIAKPLFGTTASHAAVLFATWGPDKARDFFRRVHSNCQVLSGNKQVALAVGRGDLHFGITDTDDAVIELERGQAVKIIYPDQGENQLGTLFIPNTLCLIKNGPNSSAGRELIAHLLSPQVERRLAAGPSAQFPINSKVSETSRIAPGASIKWMQADFEAAADSWEDAATFLRDVFQAAN